MEPVARPLGAVPLNPSLLSLCSGTNPITCTIPVPANGDYNVTVELGDAAAASMSRVQAELLRVVVPQLSLPAGQYSQVTFSVNVRPEVHDGYAAPGLVLNLLIDGPAPRLHGLGFASAPTIPTIFLAGDSTVCDWDPVATNILDPLTARLGARIVAIPQPRNRRRQLRRLGRDGGQLLHKVFPTRPDRDEGGRLPIHSIRAQRSESRRRHRKLSIQPDEIHYRCAGKERHAGVVHAGRSQGRQHRCSWVRWFGSTGAWLWRPRRMSRWST